MSEHTQFVNMTFCRHRFWMIFFGISLVLSLFQMGEKVFSDEEDPRLYPDTQSQLLRDLMVVDLVNNSLNDYFPVTYNNYLQGGYINMPSAQMGAEGEIGFGVSFVEPYRNYNARCQLFNQLEITGSYRIFKGIDDPVLGVHGFGEFSDKGANIKWAIIRAEDSGYSLPGVALGFDDIMGTRAFKSNYIVVTKVFPRYNFECTVGYGSNRIHNLFGGALWMPFRKCENDYLNPIAFVLEYDATHYKKDPHPKGRTQKTHFNPGIKYRLWDAFDFSFSVVRGENFAFAASTYYNFGETTGFLPKIDDPLPYCSPVNTQPLSCLRPEDVLMQDLIFPFREQGFEILVGWLSIGVCNEKILRLHVINNKYFWEVDVRKRLNALLAGLIPSDIDCVYVVMESDGFPIQQYQFQMDLVRSFADNIIGERELCLLSPMQEVEHPDPCCSRLLFKQNRDLFYYDILPKTQTFFGSAAGKFKYLLGIQFGSHGYLWEDVYYQALFGYTFFSSIESVRDTDILNPSQLINVKTDLITYYKRKGLTLDRCYLQKTWNMGNGFYSRLAGGYLGLAYGGGVAEFLYYPVNCPWAIGIEGAVVKKRDLYGFGFTNKIRKLHGHVPHYVNFLGTQCFLDLYYDWQLLQLDFKVSAGKFLANDCGARFEIARYFPSGLRISFWYTLTNAHDKINGQTYYDKGVAFSMPLDIFYQESSRDRWGYGMSAWLRDCGYRTETGKRLYEMINDQRD